MAAGTGTRRYNLVLPESLYLELQEVAQQKHMTVTDLLKQFVKLGLLVAKAESTPGLEFLIREDGVERRVLIL